MNLEGMHILLVDDDHHVLETLQTLLELEDAKITTASDGNEAFDLLCRTHDFDLVLSDVRMPGCGGIQLLEKIRNYKSAVPEVILISAFTDITPRKAKQMGASAIFMKKNMIDKLLDHVKSKKQQKIDKDKEADSSKENEPFNILNYTID